MQAAALMAIYIVTAAVVQFVGFLISRLIDYQWPTAGLLTFLYGNCVAHCRLDYRMGDCETGIQSRKGGPESHIVGPLGRPPMGFTQSDGC